MPAIRKNKPQNNWLQPLKQKFDAAHEGLLGSIRSPFEDLSVAGHPVKNPDSQRVNELRQKHYQLILLETRNSNPDYNQITKIISADIKAFIQSLIDEEAHKIGKPPCEFSVFTLGSMARQECGPITDLEIGFLVKEKTVANYRYFYQLSQRLADRLFLLGEHPDIGGKGLRMDEADNAPPHLRFFARNATPEQAQQLLNEAIYERQWDKIPYEGSRPFLTTPEEFASFSDPDFAQDKAKLNQIKNQQFKVELKKALKDPKNKQKLATKNGREQIENEVRFWVNQMYRPFSNKELRTANDAGKKLGRNIALLHGEKKLYQQFKQQRDKYFNQAQENGLAFRKNFAKTKMISDIDDQLCNEKSIYVTGKLGKTLDIKRELYRFIEQFVTNLGFYHQCQSQNCQDIIKELASRGVLSADFAAKLADQLQFATGLRLKEQAILKRQGFAAYFDQETFDDDKKDLETEISLLKTSIEYLRSIDNDPEKINEQERELVKLQDKLEHLLEMAPNQLYTAKDIRQLKDKYLPQAKEIFAQAKAWTLGNEKLGFATLGAEPTGMLEAWGRYCKMRASLKKKEELAHWIPRPSRGK